MLKQAENEGHIKRAMCGRVLKGMAVMIQRSWVEMLTANCRQLLKKWKQAC
jgi:hypothetical protein